MNAIGTTGMQSTDCMPVKLISFAIKAWRHPLTPALARWRGRRHRVLLEGAQWPPGHLGPGPGSPSSLTL